MHVLHYSNEPKRVTQGRDVESQDTHQTSDSMVNLDLTAQHTIL